MSGSTLDIDLLTKKIVCGILLVVALPVIYIMSFDQVLEKSDLTTVSGTLKASPKFGRPAKGGGYIILELDEFENEFHTNSYSYHVLKKTSSGLK